MGAAKAALCLRHLAKPLGRPRTGAMEATEALYKDVLALRMAFVGAIAHDPCREAKGASRSAPCSAS